MITIEQNESSELEAFKRKVWEVASRYATLYDWCSVVEEALNELGVNEPEQISINIKTQIGTIDAQVDKNDLPRDPEKQREFLASVIGPVHVAGKVMSIGPDFIIDAVVVDDQPEINVPYGDKARWKFVSDEGRVRHYVPNFSTVSVCEIQHYTLWTYRSSRDNGRFCKECSNHARGNRQPRKTTR